LNASPGVEILESRGYPEQEKKEKSPLNAGEEKQRKNHTQQGEW
jgi:hypothetical protein